MDQRVEWAEVNDPTWHPNFERSVRGLSVRFTGSCPRCGDHMDWDVAKALPTLGTRTAAEPFTMYCACGIPHDGHPPGDNSCGAYWLYIGEL